MALILKFSDARGHNPYAVTSLNYFMAAGSSLSVLLASPPAADLSGYTVRAFFLECSGIIAGDMTVFSFQASLIWAVIIGAAGGLFYCAGFIYIQKSIHENGVSLTGAFSKLGIFLPMTCALVVWREIPTALQATGICLAAGSILVLNLPEKDNSVSRKASWTTLSALLIATGMGDFMGKLFEKYALPESGVLFLFSLFFTALLMSLWFTVSNRRNGGVITARDILTGLIVGVPNLLTSWFLINAFRHVITPLVFPLFASGAILVITLGGVFFFNERLHAKHYLAILLIAGGVALMGT